MSHFADDETLAHIAALELEVASLRSVMADVIKAHGYAGGTPIEALSAPFNPTALPELIEKVEKMTIERCAAYLTSGRYMILNPSETYTAAQHIMAIKAHDKHQAAAIRKLGKQ